MGRSNRICEPNLTYHTYSRCIDKASLIKNDKLKDLLIKIIEETQKKFDFELNSFEILDNHFHFIITTKKKGESISKIMQRIKSVFAKRYNKLHGRTGPFWNERFGSKIVQSARGPIKYLLNLLWYLAYNPYRKGQVNDPRDYKYSSIRCYLEQNYKSKLKITIHQFFKDLGKNFEERLKIFLNLEVGYRDSLYEI